MENGVVAAFSRELKLFGFITDFNRPGGVQYVGENAISYIISKNSKMRERYGF